MTLEALLELEEDVCVFCGIPPMNKQLNDQGEVKEYYPPVSRSWEWAGQVEFALKTKGCAWLREPTGDVTVFAAIGRFQGSSASEDFPLALASAIADLAKQGEEKKWR